MPAAADAPIILATSLVPGRDQTVQAAAVASWRAAGCEVISVNGAGEAAAVRKNYPGVTVITAVSTAEKFAHKPVPYIHDLLKALRDACTARGTTLDKCTVGIINADIYLRNVPQLAATLRREAKGAVIMGPRVDVDASASFTAYRPTGSEAYSVGYDYFIMSGDVLNDFADSPFCMGMPFWDYWLPLVALLQGRTLKSLNAPLALHVTHDTRWDDSVYLFFHSLVAYVIELCRKTSGRGGAAEARQFDLLFDVLSYVYSGVFARGTEPVQGTAAPDSAGIAALSDFYDRFQQVAVHHIKSRAAAMTLTEEP